ncbi:MAG: DUF559 domain-containing protein [Bacteroidaceae bacterium]|nr:DUF559 domain-containing protein [Bacteroidaceae bacterium]
MSEHKDIDFICNRSKQKALRRHLRKQSTSAEIALWKLLKAGQIDGQRWRRQFGIGPFILDFYCPALKLGIELDGEHHFTVEGDTHDAQRTEILEKLKGIHIIRFENRDVFEQEENVVKFIKDTARERKRFLTESRT